MVQQRHVLCRQHASLELLAAARKPTTQLFCCSSLRSVANDDALMKQLDVLSPEVHDALQLRLEWSAEGLEDANADVLLHQLLL